MKKRLFGRTGLRVFPLGYGAGVLSGERLPAGGSAGAPGRLLNLALDSGINYIDTSPDYGNSEELIGRALAGRRREFVLATKCGCPDRGWRRGHEWTAERLLRNIETSLRRLRTDHVDVWQLHNPDPEMARRGGLREVMELVRRQGKARFVSVSSSLPEVLEFLAWDFFDAVQLPYSGLFRRHEAAISAAAAAGAGVSAGGCLCEGEPAAGLGRDKFWKYWPAAGLDELLAPGETRTAFLLRFALSHPRLHVALAATRSAAHLAENIRAAQAGPLPPDTYEEAKRRLAAAGQVPAPAKPHKARPPAPARRGGHIGEQLCVPMARTCNLYCVYCQNPPVSDRPSRARLVAGVKRSRIGAVSLEGRGEPTAGGDFFDWVRELRAAGVEHFMLSTNGVALADKEFCRRAEKEVDYFTVNLPAADEAGYRAATRSVRFASAMRGLRNLKALGAEGKVRLYHIIFRGNYRRLPAFADWVIKKHPKVAFVNFTFVRNAGRVADSPDIVPRYSEVEPYLKLALGKLKLAGVRAVAQNMPLCRLNNFEGFSFEFQRWLRGDRVLEAGVAGKAAHPACRRCALAPACCGARADYLKIHGGGELAASAKKPESIKPEAF